MTHIRRAVAADIPQILRFLTAMAAEAGAEIGSTEASLAAHGFGPTPRFHGLIADDAGMILFFPEYSTWRGEMGLFVQDVYVAPARRGHGLAQELMAAAMTQADWQPRFLTLMVAHQNTKARKFYERMGLTPRDAADQLILEGQGLAALMQA